MADELEFLARDVPPPAYDIRDLGLLDDGRFCRALAVNKHGHIVGEADTTEGVHAFVWRTGEIEDLTPGRNVYSRAQAINDHGTILGLIESAPNAGRTAWLWTGEQPISLQELGISGDGARAINNDDQIVGQMAFAADRPPSAFLWRLGNVTDLAGPYVDGSTAEAVNDYGQVAGHMSSLKQYDQAFLWSDGELIDLGIGQAYAISDQALVAGMTYGAGGKPLACVWESLIRREIPLLPGATGSLALGVNNGEEVVGAMVFPDGARTAFLWKREFVIDLNQVIDASLGWSLQEARAVNASGQIVGWGFLEHRHHGYLLTPNDRSQSPSPPEPRPRQGAAAVDVPEIASEREESSFEDMILQQILAESKR